MKNLIMEEVGNRIKRLIEIKEISNSQMADSIDLPRPVLSHILSGRNKASLSVIQKILLGYPDVDPKWLLLGEGEMLKSETSIQDIEEIESEIYMEERKENVSESILKPKLQSNLDATSELESIVHYYNDGSFKVFLPKSL